MIKMSKVHGVGRVTISPQERGTIKLKLKISNKNFIIILYNVLYIPKNKHNLISLGKWDKSGGKYVGGDGKIYLQKNNEQVACGELIETNLYKMFVHAIKPIASSKITPSSVEEVNKTMGNVIDWEIWHCRFSHVRYHGLERLLDENLVDGFNVNHGSIKTDCQSCTEAKHTINPFPKETESKLTVKGKITHMDLVGPINIVLLNGNSYFLMLVDNTT